MIDESYILFFKKASQQFSTFALIGILTNLLGYGIYLSVTYFWCAPKLTMTILYFMGASISFFANRRFTFRHVEGFSVTGVRYLLTQFAGYLLNLILLRVFVDCFKFPHHNVQAIAIFVVAIFLFVVMRVFVFAPSTAEAGMESQ